MTESLIKPIKLTKKERERNRVLLEKIIVAFLEPVLILILFQGNFISKIIAVIWFITNLIIVFNDRDTLIINILRLRLEF